MKNERLPKKLLPFLWYFLKKYKISFILYIFLTLFVLDIFITLFLQPYLGKIFFDKIDNNTITMFSGFWLIVGIVLSDLFFPLLSIINIFKFNSVAKAIEDIRDNMFNYSIKHSINFFNTNYSGELSNKINAITDILEETLQSILGIIRNFLFVICLIFIFLYFSKLLGFFVFIWFLLYSWVGYYFLIKKASYQSKLIQEDQNKISAFITDDFLNIQNIKMFSNKNKEKRQLLKLLTNKFRKVHLEIKYQQISREFYFILGFLLFFIVFVVALYQLKNNIITIGSFVFLITITKNTLSFSRQICHSFYCIKNLVIMKDSLDIITDDIEIKDKKDAEKLVVNNGKIVFKNITFNFNNK